MATKPKSQRSGAGAPGPERRRQPESLRLNSITPTYTVNDVQRSLAWYQDGLGFFVSERWEEGGRLQGVMLKAGNSHIGLSQDDFSKGRDRAKGLGFRIWCDTTQDVDAIAARLRAFGGTIVEEPGEHWDTYSFTAQDPDGFKITITRAKD
jgi:catechol 2,3-dioxygenase-like lactoylglutathione lyase family enzyme